MKVVVADDHPLFLLGLKHGLQDAGAQVVAAVDNGFKAVEACRAKRPDACILDVRMPGIDGIQACKSIVSEAPDSIVIMLTTWMEAHVVDASKAAGARALLSKEQGAVEVLRIAKRLLEDPRLRLFPTTDSPELTQREMQVLDGLARGLTRKKIAAELDLSPETVKDHAASLFAKLAAHDRVTAVTNAVGLGVMPLPPVGGGDAAT